MDCTQRQVRGVKYAIKLVIELQLHMLQRGDFGLPLHHPETQDLAVQHLLLLLNGLVLLLDHSSVGRRGAGELSGEPNQR